jgi:hypothetical protein
MPNINSLPSITATSSGTFVIVTDNGFARRLPYTQITNSFNNTIVGDNRTDQPLFSTSSVSFNNVTLIDNNTSTFQLRHGFTSFTNGYSGGPVLQFENLGQLKFVGYDGVNQPSDTTLPSFQLGTFAFENFAGVSGRTNNGGAGWQISVQPSGTQMTALSRQRMIFGGFPFGPTVSNTPPLPPIGLLRFGSGIDGAFPTLVTSTGTTMQPGFGRTLIEFINSSIGIFGVTSSDTSPENDTVTGTNFISIYSGRTSAIGSRHTPIKNNDSLGGIVFNGATSTGTTSTTNYGHVRVGAIVANAIQDFGSGNDAINLVFQTNNVSASPNKAKLLLSEPVNNYTSNNHSFKTVNQTSVLDISSSLTTMFNGTFQFHSTGTIVFPDSTVQKTAYPGYSGGRPVGVPASSSSPGTVGDVAWDQAYVYICVDTNTWRRSVATGF